MSQQPGMNRRRLLGGALATGAIASFPLGTRSSAAAGDVPPTSSRGWLPADRIGIQMFTVRDLLADNELDLPGTLEILADAGIAEIELAGNYDGRTAAEVRAITKSFGLKIAGNHYGPRTMVQNIWYDPAERARIFEEAHVLGLRQVGTGHSYVAPLTVDGYKEMAAAFNVWGEDAVRNGFDYFYFHNHDLEFAVVDGKPLFDILLEETDPRYVRFELDLGWLTVSGLDARAYLEEYGDRFPMFHVKDIKWDPDGPRAAHPATVNADKRFRFVDVGKGDINWATLFSALKDLRNHHFLIEHDDAGNDETADATSPRPRNPAGSANTAWTSSKYLSQLRPKRA